MSDALILKGKIWFNEWEIKRDIINAVLRKENGEERLRIQFIEDQGEEYEAHLHKTTGNIFKGRYLYMGKEYTDEISCRLYSFGDEYFLYGQWLEEGNDLEWYCLMHVESKETF